MFFCNILICKCMQNHNDDTIKTSGHGSLEKYTSHFLERVRKGYEGYYCVRGELETEQNCNILTPTLMAITSFLSRSPGLLNWGPGGPSLCWNMFLIPASSLQLIWTSCRRGYIIVLRPLNSTRRQSRPSPDLLISSTGRTCYLHRCISSFDSLAGSEVNIQPFCYITLLVKLKKRMTFRLYFCCKVSKLFKSSTFIKWNRFHLQGWNFYPK